MNSKKICPRDCPGRYPGCGAKCPTWIEHRAEAMKLYEEREKQIKIADFLRDGYDMRRRRA
jgi:hypothetical protein